MRYAFHDLMYSKVLDISNKLGVRLCAVISLWHKRFALLLVLFVVFPIITEAQNKKIAVFGSSVAKGSGDTTGTGGYAGMIKTMMEERGWSVANVSRGGDNTVKIMPRFSAELLPEKPRYVIIGLSLGNEGIVSQSELTRERVFERYRSGVARLVKLCRMNGMVPVVVNCYVRNDFRQEQYAAIRKMNLLLDTWDVPVINALGAVDDGTGKWAEGYWHDKSHPNEKGHREMFYAFVPGLFDALEAGKGTPEKVRSSNFLSVEAGSSTKPLAYIPDDSLHSFTVGFQVKSKEEGTIAAIIGEKSQLSVALKQGKIVCEMPGKETIAGDTVDENSGWQYVVISHRYATGMTTFFVNGKSAGSIAGHVDFREFILGGSGNVTEPAPHPACFRDLLIYRSALNEDEVRAIYCDQLLQASLEIYAPLNDPEFRSGTVAVNLAQSMSKLMISGDHLVSVVDSGGKTTK